MVRQAVMARPQRLIGRTDKDTTNDPLSYLVGMGSQQDVLDWPDEEID